MSGLFSRVKNWVSGDTYEDDLYMDDEYESVDSAQAYRATAGRSETSHHDVLSETPKKSKANLKVLEHPSSHATQVVVIEPRAFEEALEIIDHLRTKKSVILNLHLLDTAQSQRVVDFLSGATHAIDGHQQRIGDGVFIFTPNNVMIMSESDKGASISSDAFWNGAVR
jgi:cell division inhibitor SepF